MGHINIIHMGITIISLVLAIIGLYGYIHYKKVRDKDGFYASVVGLIMLTGITVYTMIKF